MEAGISHQMRPAAISHNRVHRPDNATASSMNPVARTRNSSSTNGSTSRSALVALVQPRPPQNAQPENLVRNQQLSRSMISVDSGYRSLFDGVGAAFDPECCQK